MASKLVCMCCEVVQIVEMQYGYGLFAAVAVAGPLRCAVLHVLKLQTGQGTGTELLSSPDLEVSRDGSHHIKLLTTDHSTVCCCRKKYYSLQPQ